MYRLTVIAAPANARPARGSTFAVGAGTFAIGRHSQNQIVLHSGNVSKRHCVLVVDNTRATVEDQGSSNGTFVNGKLSARREIAPGDRISVGEFVFELSEGGAAALVPVRTNVVAFPGPSLSPAASVSLDTLEDAPMPRDPLGKIKYHFDRYVLPYFFGFNERYEWRVVIGSLFGMYLALNLVISLSPLMDEQQKAIEREMSNRARVMARELAERNTPFLAAKNESRLDLGSFERAWGVRVAVIVDLENRILAPASKAGRHFELGSEATTAVKARKAFIAGKQDGLVLKSDDTTIVAVEPIQVLNPTLGKNQTVGMAIVSIDTTLGSAEGGELWLVYAHTLVLSIIIGLFVFYLIYRITLRPFQEMNKKVDQVLRGEAVDFKPSVYFSEVEPLWDLVDSALKRVPRGDDAGNAGGGGSSFTAHDLLGPLKTLAIGGTNGVAILDDEKNILFLNSVFEEITGIRSEAGVGQALSAVSRDQAFSSLISELCDRAMPGNEGASEEFDFSGIVFHVHVAAFGSFGDPKCFVFNLVRKEE